MPKEDDATYRVWDTENYMVMTWLINSMEAKIGQTYLFLPTAQELQDTVQDTYYDLGNLA